jgi:Ca-activated chloride channel family protein
MIDWTEFHFLRPAWLFAFVFLIPLFWAGTRGQRTGGAWRNVCDAHLLRHLITDGGGRTRYWPLALAAAGWIVSCLAMAGPAWERSPQPAFRSPEQRVLALNLAPSMNAGDVQPSRLARARYELQDALDALGGAQAGLLIFNEEPYVVTPVTDDPRVVAELLPILETDLMPGRGVRVDRAIDAARELLDQAGAVSGGIVLVTDSAGDDAKAAVRAAKDAASAGYEVSVLAIGTEAGAPIPTRRGFVRDGAGELVMARVDHDTLAAVAKAGGGSYARMSADDRDIAAVLNLGATPLDVRGNLEEAGVEADVWKDAGILLVWLVALLSPLAFRRGWATSLVLCLVVGATTLPSSRAEADVADWLKRPDQRGAEAFAEGRHDEAAVLFEDPDWRAAALYRGGAYAEAAALMSENTAPVGQYNLGNALARAGRFEDALAAYDRVLVAQSEHADAQHNRDLVAKLLEEQQQQQQDQQSSGSDAGSESDSASDDSSESSSSDSSSGGESGTEPGAESDSSDASETGENTDAANEEAAESGEGQSSSGSADAPAEAETQAASTDAAENDGPEGQSAEAQERAGEPSSARPGGEPSSESDSSKQAVGSPAESQSGQPGEEDEAGPTRSSMAEQPLSEREQAVERWLNRIDDDPGGLLREKLRRRYAEKRYLDAMGGPSR